MPKPKLPFPTGKIRAREVDLEALDHAVDTAGSWDGDFPEPGRGDYLVTLAAHDRDEETVLVSRRYTSAVDPADAASLALSSFAERHDYESDDEGELVPIVVDGDSYPPVWVVRVAALV